MNPIFYAMMLVAFLWSAWAQLGFVPAPPGTEGAPLPPMEVLTTSLFDSAKGAVDLVIKLIGPMCFFLGLMKVAEAGGLMQIIARLIRPLMVRLFPEVPADHPAMGAMILNLSANALGLGNAATPFGLRAMQELDKLNPYKGTATNAMALFLAINTASVTLLPTGVIALRQAAGSQDPAAVLPTTLFASICSTSVGVLCALLFSRTWATAEACTPAEDVVALPPVEREAVDDSYPFWVSALALAALAAAIPLTVVYGGALGPWFVPVLTVGLLTFGQVRGVKVYEQFVAGARDGWDTATRIIPYLVAVLTAVGMLRASGVIASVVKVLDPWTSPLGLPGEALPMALLRSFSGSGANGVMVSIINDKAIGPDSYTGLLVSTIQGSSETTFYVLAVYYGAIGVKRVRHTLAAALLADVAGIAGSIVAAKLWFAYGV
jgi:spore maturation protein SpmA